MPDDDHPAEAACSGWDLSAGERWVIQKAVYGLEASPADWSSFRDQRVKKFEWSSNGRAFWMRQTVEPMSGKSCQVRSQEERTRMNG